ncbi:hypothetical protein [Streptomyces sp. URMC 123]|uniref:hypothetical protein n=1 Tax=Streptomyces sp. URMC 123 TaxID=3423403 RepID=UPI003F1A211A
MKYTKAAAVIAGSVMALGTATPAFAADGKGGPAGSLRANTSKLLGLNEQQTREVTAPLEKPVNDLVRSTDETAEEGGEVVGQVAMRQVKHLHRHAKEQVEHSAQSKKSRTDVSPMENLRLVKLPTGMMPTGMVPTAR